jgi:hypothetical protein
MKIVKGNRVFEIKVEGFQMRVYEGDEYAIAVTPRHITSTLHFEVINKKILNGGKPLSGLAVDPEQARELKTLAGSVEFTEREKSEKAVHSAMNELKCLCDAAAVEQRRREDE